jgi:putative hemolysin
LDTSFVYLIALVCLIAVSAFFSGSEAALFSIPASDVNRLRKQSAAGRRIAGLLGTPRRLLITILIGNLIVNVFSTSAATSIAMKMFGDKGIGIAFAFMSLVILIFGEIAPKVVAINGPVRFSRVIVYPLSVIHAVFHVVSWPISKFTGLIIDTLKRRIGTASKQFSREELMTALNIGRDDGHLGDFEYELLTNIIEFRETTVREIMTPSINVFSLPIDLTYDELRESVLKSGFSRVPIYGETTDDIKGILHIKNLARIAEEDADFDLNSILIRPYYIPESARIYFLFGELGRRRAHTAVVIDEHGSYVGIVTMEDILEEIVGEIRDSREPQTTTHHFLPDGRIVVNGSMELEEFNEVFGVDIVDDDHETIAGYLTGAIGDIPNEGETIALGNLKFHIISAQPNRIRKMRVERA